MYFSAWVWTSPRHDMFDFIPVVNDRMVLALMKKAMDRGALDLYFRPFTIEVWIMICITLGIIAIILISLSYFETIFISNKESDKNCLIL